MMKINKIVLNAYKINICRFILDHFLRIISPYFGCWEILWTQLISDLELPVISEMDIYNKTGKYHIFGLMNVILPTFHGVLARLDYPRSKNIRGYLYYIWSV